MIAEERYLAFTLRSPAFSDGGDIPKLFTCQGENISPPLEWSDPPEGAESFALIAEDLDTPFGVLTHWVLYNLPSGIRELDQGVPHRKPFPAGWVQGKNGLRRNGYLGPCPPWGRHRYTFGLYALDTLLEPNPNYGKRRLLKAMTPHILAESRITGFYARK